MTKSLQPLLGKTISPLETKLASKEKEYNIKADSKTKACAEFLNESTQQNSHSKYVHMSPLKRMQTIKMHSKSSLTSTTEYNEHGLIFTGEKMSVETGSGAKGIKPAVDMSKGSPFRFINKLIQNPHSEEFCYLKPRGPYDLRIVKHDHKDSRNYFTMSKRGVTHFYNGATEFTPLEQWEREYFLFVEIKQIKFFRQFQIWKIFYFWNKFIRKLKNDKCRKFLKENLYMLNPHLRPSLTELQVHCFQLSQMSLFPLDDMQLEEVETMSLNNFVQKRVNQIEVVEATLHSKLETIRSIVAKSCKDDCETFLITNGFKASNDKGTEKKVSHAENAAKRTK